MKRFIKAHCTMLAFLGVIITTSVILIGMQIGARGGALELVDVSGNRSALDSFTVHGQISESDFYQSFTITSKGIRRDFHAEPLMYELPNEYLSHELVINDTAHTRIFRGDQGMQVATDRVDVYAHYFKKEQQFNYWKETDTCRWKTNIYAQSEEPEFIFSYLEEDWSENVTFETGPYGATHTDEGRLAKIDGVIYCTIETNEYCKGENGIYRIDKLKNMDDEGNTAQATPIASFPLNNTVTLGLRAIKGDLLLMLIQDGAPLFRLYDTQGNLLDELAFPADTDLRTGIPYFNQDGDAQALSMLLFPGDADWYRAVGLHIQDGRLTQTFDITADQFLDSNVYYSYAGQKDGKLFLAGMPILSYVSDSPVPRNLSEDYLLLVYDDTGELYRGKLKTDIRQDYGKFLNALVRFEDPYPYYTYGMRWLDITEVE